MLIIEDVLLNNHYSNYLEVATLNNLIFTSLDSNILSPFLEIKTLIN